MICPFKVGDKVYRIYPFDGTPKQGYPNKSQVYTVSRIEKHTPVDGPSLGFVIYLFPGGSWSFHQGLVPINYKP